MITSKDEGQNAERPRGAKSGRVNEIRIRLGCTHELSYVFFLKHRYIFSRVANN